MARFLIRNYGLSRQIPYKGKQVCLSNDQAIEIDDVELAAVMKAKENMHVHDRGAEFTTPVPPEELKRPDKKERLPVTVDNAEAVHAEKFPDEDEQQPRTQQEPPVEAKTDTDEIAYDDMLIKELQVLAKDRTPPIKTSGLKKDELIEALKAYDAEG